MGEHLKRSAAHTGSRIFYITLFLTILLAGVVWGAIQYESPTNRRASEVLPSRLLSGPHFRVQDRVVADGYLFRFTVSSDYGTFLVGGKYGLRKLVREIQAISALRRVNQGQAVLDGARGKARETLEFGVKLANAPLDTVVSIPQGVAKLFANISGGLQNSHDPRRDTVAEKVLNVSGAKRKLAYDLGVDVYSSNRVLQSELDSVARAQALGAMAVTAAIPYGGGTAVSLSGMSRTAREVNGLLRDEPPAALRTRNQGKLQAMGVDSGLAGRFLNHYAFTPRHQTIIVACLEKLTGAQGRNNFISFALSANDEETANFFQNMAEILENYQRTVSPIREINLPGVLVARTANGAALVPFPLDYGVWSPRAEGVVKKTLAGQPGRSKPARIELWVSGVMSPLARNRLETQGIRVVENVDQRIGLSD
ncbi:MAG: hypothetical protein ACYDIC_14085 [Desulfobaccales bacterium]